MSQEEINMVDIKKHNNITTILYINYQHTVQSKNCVSLDKRLAAVMSEQFNKSKLTIQAVLLSKPNKDHIIINSNKTKLIYKVAKYQRIFIYHFDHVT